MSMIEDETDGRCKKQVIKINLKYLWHIRIVLYLHKEVVLHFYDASGGEFSSVLEGALSK